MPVKKSESAKELESKSGRDSFEKESDRVCEKESDFERILTAHNIQKVLNYIEAYWPKITRKHTKDKGTLIGLPNPYIVPAPSFFEEQYYWDSYPIVFALLKSKEHQKLAKGMVDNLLYLFSRFGLVPNGSRFYYLSRSQPPFLSSMVWEVFEATHDFSWFRKAIKIVEAEYQNVWMGQAHPHERQVYCGLSRYYDVNLLHDLAMAESGWDNTARFGGWCLDFLPVDLNCLLYKYEQDLSRAFGLMEDFEREEKYTKAARARAKTINLLMWDEKGGYYFDFDFPKQQRSGAVTVAGILPMTFGIATSEQAKEIVGTIEKTLEADWGVVQSEDFGKENMQWDFPNGWPLQQLLVCHGLLRYGYMDLAKRLVMKWLAVNIKLFLGTGYLWEKYDVVHGKIGVPDRYPTQPGFGWTNACFILLWQMYQGLIVKDEKLRNEGIVALPVLF